MERILLIEPNYKNKYPPIGLMKISSYFKKKGDYVEFHKGLLTQNEVKTFDKILITTLFTFDFKMCIQTIRYYIAIVGIEKVFVGGIAASIMPDNFLSEIPGLNIITGQLDSSKKLGYDDDVNIDILELDYDILWDVAYEYPMGDSYFLYTTRGCPRKCGFCAIKTLEPVFSDCDNIEEQILAVDSRFGIKKNLLVMDNNILFSKDLFQKVDIIKGLGFGVGNNTARKISNMKYFIQSLKDRINIGKSYINLLTRLKKEFLDLKFVRISKNDCEYLKEVIDLVHQNNDSVIVEYCIANENSLVDFFERYNYKKISRFVDFNQGLDARLFTREIAAKLGELAVDPCRIAFDDLRCKEDYFRAMEFCVSGGIRRFSNYLLYNFEEKPEDLWKRLYLNVEFCKKHSNVLLFSFPMKYAAIDQTDRTYIGRNWNRKYLRAINVILNVTKGVVAKEEDFFLRAFGKDEAEYLEILSMPDEFIRFRDFFESKGLTQLWKARYSALTCEEKEELIRILSDMVDISSLANAEYSLGINGILPFYAIKKRNVVDNEFYYSNIVKRALLH